MASAHIVVVGGSLGGLLAANLLGRAGHRVTVLEKASQSLDGRGAGIVTHSGLLAALRAAGAVVDDSLGVAVRCRVALDAWGAEADRIDHPQLLTSWSRLYALLQSALPTGHCLAGHELVSLAQHEAGVEVQCQNGVRFEADLLVASDGIRSAVRAACAPAAQAQYAGYVAWRGVCDEATLSANTLATLFPHFGFGLPDGEQIIGYPVAGAGNTTQVGSRRYNFVWYRPAHATDRLPALMTDDSGHHHTGGIPPHKVSQAEVRGMRADAHRLLAPQWAEVVAITAQPFIQPIFDLMSDRLAFGRIALMGDAAFVARPHVGMGVTKAADDALALVQAIGRHGAKPAALAAYESARLATGRLVVERGRRLGAYLQARAANAPQAGDAAAQRSVRDVLKQTAIDLALAA